MSYNVQISTDAAHGIAVGLDVGQTSPDYEHLAPAVDQIEERLGQISRAVTPFEDAGMRLAPRLVASARTPASIAGILCGGS